MTEKIKVAEYHNRPIVELELPGGEVLKLRQPLEQDYFRWQDVTQEHRRRVTDYGEELAKRAAKRAEETGDPDEGKALLREESAEERIPVEVTVRYLLASRLAIFIEPEQTPERLLDVLGPDIIHELLQRIDAIIGGDAAKKRLAGN
ncbi:MAG: hypothetical protein JW990_07750 [Thermoleophilia bacterium]|nr:hypothetical protein [Thermoleophilia bacterium]